MLRSQRRIGRWRCGAEVVNGRDVPLEDAVDGFVVGKVVLVGPDILCFVVIVRLGDGDERQRQHCEERPRSR